MTEKRQEKLQVCKNNWVRRITRVKRINKRRMEELREEVGGRESHEEAADELAKVGWTCGKNGRLRLMKRLGALRVECRRGRLRLRWEDCGGEGWGEWRQVVEMAVLKKKQSLMTGIGASLTPDYRDKEESNKIAHYVAY